MLLMHSIKQWDIWLTDFPYEEDHNQFSSRPVIVLSVEPLWLLSVKVTKHDLRYFDPFDVKIEKWKESGLECPSTARVSKTAGLSVTNFAKKLGTLHPDERLKIVQTFYDFMQTRSESKAVNE